MQRASRAENMQSVATEYTRNMERIGRACAEYMRENLQSIHVETMQRICMGPGGKNRGIGTEYGTRAQRAWRADRMRSGRNEYAENMKRRIRGQDETMQRRWADYAEMMHRECREEDADNMQSKRREYRPPPVIKYLEV